MPHRIQRKRTKGWKMPENTVYVGRPTKWGNPYTLQGWSRERAVSLYRGYAVRKFGNLKAQLGGKNLACWCPLDQPCHADVLLELANGGEK